MSTTKDDNDDQSDYDDDDDDENVNDEDDDDDSEDDDEDEDELQVKQQEPATKRSRLDATPLDVSAASMSTNNTKIVINNNTTKNTNQPIIILLDLATIETIKNKRGIYELINCDDHREICKRKLHQDPNNYRPDILHQELLAVLDSPLNKVGLLKVYIKTKHNVLIDVHPSIRIPRTYKRFAGLMVQLLHKMKIKATTTSATTSNNDNADTFSGVTLLKVIKNPFHQYLPPNTRCYGMSCNGTLYSPITLASTLLSKDNDKGTTSSSSSSSSVCFIVGAMSTGHVTMEDHPYIEQMISISSHPLSGAAALSRIMTGIEHYYGIV